MFHPQNVKNLLHHPFKYKGYLVILQITRLTHTNILLVKKTFVFKKMCKELVLATGCVLEFSILFLLLCFISDKSQFSDSMA